MYRLVLPGGVLLAAALTGCGVSAPLDSTPMQTPLGAISGKLYGGQQAVQGAHVYVFQVGTTGYGAASVSLLGNIPGVTTADTTTLTGQTIYYVTTGSAARGGSFSVTGDYTCTAGTQIYLLALGGSPDAGAHTNSGIGLMAGLGSCPATGTLAAQAPYVTINEVSTIATAYALAGFAVDAEHISSDAGVSGNATGSLAANGAANAMANVANIENVATGAALTTTPASGSSGVVPQTTLNTLANILAACVNATASTAASCNTLFGAATADSTATGAKPADTATAAINIAHFPGANITALYGLVGSTPPFVPGLSMQPNDFTVGLQFSGGGLSSLPSLAIDAVGNVWIADDYGDRVVKFSPTGSVLSGSGGFTGGGIDDPYSIALDTSGNAWVANTGHSNDGISKLSSTGAAISPSGGYTGGGVYDAVGVALDGMGNVWVSDYPGAVSKLSSAGAGLSGSNGFTGSGLAYAESIAIDGSGNAWVPNHGSSLTKLSAAGGPLSGASGFTGGGLNQPYAVAIDGSGNAWVPNFGVSTLSKFSPAGTALSGTNGFTGGGLNQPYAISIDGAGSVWVANEGGNSVSKFSASGAAISGSGGFTGGGISGPFTIAIDGSGNVWVGSFSLPLTELLGAAAPVITPISAGLPSTASANGSSKLGSRP